MDKKKGWLIIVIVVLVLGTIGGVASYFYLSDNKVRDNSVGEEDGDAGKVASDVKIESNGLEDFDLSFLKLENNEENIVYSPLSIKYALSMLSRASLGSTKNQIDSVIGDYNAKIYDNNQYMTLANAFFVRNSFKDSIKSDYVNLLKETYGADIVYDSFNSPSVVNDWVSEHTYGLINNLLEDVSDFNYILVNALAIDMNWNYLIQDVEYDALNREVRGLNYNVKFYHEDYHENISTIMEEYYSLLFNDSYNAKAVEIGATVNNYDIVNTLGEENIRKTITEEYTEYIQSGKCDSTGDEDVDAFVDNFIAELDANYQKVYYSTDYRFYVNDDVKVFAKELQENNGTTLEYIGIMPTNEELSSYIDSVSASDINSLIDNLLPIESASFAPGKVYKITGYIPLFNFEYEIKLMKDLQSLGITDVFEPGVADLGNMTDSKTNISAAKHKANIEFSNDGITAAAVTYFANEISALNDCYFDHLYEVPVEEIDLTFDKPYMFLIRDKDTGEVWFMGATYEPTENS